MPMIESVFARDLKVGDVLADPAPEVYTGAPGGPFVEHTKVVGIEHEYLRGAALGRVRDFSDTRSPEEMLYTLFPDAEGIDLTDAQPLLEALGKVARWVPAAHPSHEIPQVHVMTRRYGEQGPQVGTKPELESWEREVHDDGSQLNSEQTVVYRWGAVVNVIRGDLLDLTKKE